MSKKNMLVSHLKEMWYWYLLVPVLVAAVWSFVFGLLDKIPYKQQIHVFVAAHEVNTTDMEEQIYELVREDDIRQVAIDRCTPGTEEGFYTALSTRGLVYTDILILPEGTWPESIFQGSLLGFTEAEMESYLPEGEYEYLWYGDSIYGIRVYDCETGESSLPDTWINYKADIENRDYYLFVNAGSDNVGTKNKESEDLDVQVLLLLERLFQSMEVLQ